MEDVLNSKILIIEGRHTSPPLMIDQLRPYRFTEVLSIPPEHALERLNGKLFDIVFYRLEFVNGENEQIIKNIKIHFPDIPLVMVSKNTSPAIMRRSIRLGVFDYLEEPFEISEIPGLIARNLERKLVTDHHVLKKQSEVLMKAIKALIAAMEAKDRSTSGHSMRVVQYAMMMTKKLNLSHDEKFVLQLAAALHDIGKIGMPDDILKKATSLKDIEYHRVREHPVIGSRIVGEIDDLSEVAEVIKHHHERFDGTGYPGQLKGTEIPLFSRLLAIVDAYESLINDRIYRKAVDREEAIAELRRSSGTQFDPELLELFIEEISKEKKPEPEPALVDERF